MQDFVRLANHLDFLFGVAVIEKHIDVRNRVERDLVRENARLTLAKCEVEESLRLGNELFHALFARPAHGLVGADIDTFDSEALV